jgi:hypothetical protein
MRVPSFFNSTAAFIAAFTFLILVSVTLYGRLPDFVDEAAVDFSIVPDDEVIVHVGLLRRQHSSLKVGFIESDSFVPPRVSLLGNHQVRYFSRSAFGDAAPKDIFFNLFYANLGLPDVRDYLLYLEKIKKLPTDLVLVQVTTPNNDNGKHIIEFGGEMLLKVSLSDEAIATNTFIENFVRVFEAGFEELKRIVSYDTFLLGLFAGGKQIQQINLQKCETIRGQAPEGWRRILSSMNVLPGAMLSSFGVLDKAVLCKKEYLHQSYRSDGSVLSYMPENLNQNENPLDTKTASIRRGDEEVIARYLKEIIDIGARNERQIVFLVPPVYETARRSLVNDIFSKALTLVPNLNIIDHRELYLGPEYFTSYDHPAELYFKIVVDELVQRNFLRIQ